MTQPKYEQVEHTADIAFRIYGESVEELFAHAAEALCSVLGKFDTPHCEVNRTVRLEAQGYEALLHDWLAELNYLHQTRKEIYHVFEIGQISQNGLEATIRGEPIDLKRHTIEIEIKAVTYHQLSVRQSEEGWQAFVIFDI